MNETALREKWAATEALHEAGIAMMRQKFLRENAGDPALAETRFLRWLLREDDPIPGDVAGSVRVSYRSQ